MSVVEFRSDDNGFLGWLAAHATGYVLNIQAGLTPSDARIHRATCGFLTAPARQGKALTTSYIKICAPHPTDLDQWARQHTAAVIRRCGTCRPEPETNDASNPPTASNNPAASRTVPPAPSDTAPYRLDVRDLPSGDLRLAGLRYIPFERLTSAQTAARAQLRALLSTLEAGPGQILEASYAGPKPPNADVENLVLYNIDIGGASLLPACRHGVRFELVPESGREGEVEHPTGCAYRYRLVSIDSRPTHWRPRRRLAHFAHADLGHLHPDHPLARTWLAIHQLSRVDVAATPAAGDEPFGVFLILSGPARAAGRIRPELVKSLIDGTVAALQAQADAGAVGVAGPVVAAQLGQKPDDIRDLLLDRRRAVLGVLDRLVYPRAGGVQWNPGDHLCVAGQVIHTDAEGPGWSLSGQIWTLEPK